MLGANPDLPSNVGPGQYLYLNSRGQNPGSQDRARSGRFRLNIVAPVTSDGLLYATLDTPRLMGGLDDVVTQCGKRSVARQMAEYAYTAIPGGVDVYVTPIVMSGGTSAAFNLYCATIAGATAAVGSGQATIRFDDYPVPVDIVSGDTPGAIMAKVKAAYDSYIAPSLGGGKGVPFTSGAVAGNALPFTGSTTGEYLNDHPIAVQFPSTVTGVGFSPGFLTFAGGPTGAAGGSVTVRCHAKSFTASAIPINQTNVNVASLVVAAANAQTDFPLRLVQRPAPDDDKVDFFYKNGRPAHDLQVTATGIAAVTVTLTGETAGTGVPSLSNALNALASSDAKQEWATCFTDSASLGALVQHIRTYGNGYNQKEQFLWWASSLGLSSAGAIVSGITPSVIFEDAAQGSPGRNTQVVCPNAFQPAYCLVAMLACGRAAEQRPTKNWDGYPLVSNLEGIPLTYPDAADRLNDAAANQARSVYFMTPLIVRRGNFIVQQFTSTYGGTLPFWSGGYYARGMAYIRQEELAALSVFSGKEIVRYSAALTPEVFDVGAVVAVMYSAAKKLEQQNLYDGADKFKALFAAEIDPNNAEWVRVYCPGSPPINNHVIAGQIGPVSV